MGRANLYNHQHPRSTLITCPPGARMAVNLPPQYHDAEARYKKARTPEDKLVALREMWVILPKHKASEKVQAELKTKISELTD